ncbi:MAG TPA: hypothetical protein VIE63_03700 [Ramlibacter sp.]
MDRNPASRDVDALVRDFYSVFDNRAGRRADVEQVTALFHHGAVIAKRTPCGFETSAPAEFARPRVALLRAGSLLDFHEWEVSSETRIEGDLASRISRYDKAGAMNGQPYAGSGTKLFQLIRERGRWQIISLAWADDE